MKKGRRWVGLVMAVLVILLLVSGLFSTVSAKSAPATWFRQTDAGNFNDYGGGGGGGDWGGGDWGGNDDGYFFFGGDSSGDSDGGDVIVGFLIFGVIILFAILKMRNAKKSAGTETGSSGNVGLPPANFETKILPVLLASDPNFSRDGFVEYAKDTYLKVQQAWSDRDLETLRQLEKEELFAQQKTQVEEYIRLHRINVMERMCVYDAYLHLYVRDAQFESLTVYLDTRAIDYVKDEQTGQVLMGNPGVSSHSRYLYTFMRKRGIRTGSGTGAKAISCPYCGAPVEITSAGRCLYCDHIVKTDAHDWVLSAMEPVRPGMSADNRGVVLKDSPEEGNPCSKS